MRTKFSYNAARGDEETCGESFDGWWCTRPIGHSGLHAAHSYSDTEAVAIWGDDGDEEYDTVEPDHLKVYKAEKSRMNGAAK